MEWRGVGGMTQWLVTNNSCKQVDTLCFDREGHGQHRLLEKKTPGYQKS